MPRAKRPELPTKSDLLSILNLSALGAITIWSATAPFSKYALRDFPVLAYTAIRPVVGVCIMALILISRGQPLAIERRDFPRLLLTGMFGIGMSQLTYTGALSRTSVAHTVIIASVSPLLVAGYRLGIKRQRLPMKSLLGMLGGFAGVVVLILGSGGSSDTSLLGDGLALVSAVTWMGATIWPAELINKYGIMRVNLWMFGSALLATGPLGLREMPQVIHHPPHLVSWGALVYAAIFGMVVGNFLWQRAVQQVGSSRTLVYLYLQPVGAMVLAALVLGERLSPIQAAGGVLALIGVALVRRD